MDLLIHTPNFHSDFPFHRHAIGNAGTPAEKDIVCRQGPTYYGSDLLRGLNSAAGNSMDNVALDAGYSLVSPLPCD
jgi:hypothetical protein